MHSINITIHNKAYLLPLFLENLKNFTTGEFEIIFTMDGCTDNSTVLVHNFAFQNRKSCPVSGIWISENVFETKANNLAAQKSKGNHIIILQDDMIVNELGWNERLLKPFQAFDDVFAVTGNCAHNWELNKNSSLVVDNDIKLPETKITGWSDVLNHIHHANKANTNRETFAIRDCVNRGPLAINRADLVAMNYFDEAFCPQDSDDHDLCYRMHKKLGKVVGYYPVEWYSKPEWGGTRDENGNTKQFMFEANHKNTRLLYDRHKDYMGTCQQESRNLK